MKYDKSVSPSSKPKVSVVIPAYNEAKHIGACLEALGKQTVPQFEIIVVDNNSTDNTFKIAKSFSGVKVIKEAHQGIVYARTTGFNATQGEIIGRIDADTIVEPNWIERVIEDFKDPDLAAVTGLFYYHDVPLPTVSREIDKAIRVGMFKSLGKYKVLNGANMALRRSAWLEIRSELCSDSDIHEDVDIAIHLGLKDYKVEMDSKLVAGTSIRRVDENPDQYLKYLQMLPRTYKRHNVPGEAAATATIGLLMLGYVPIQLIKKVYTNTQNVKKTPKA